MLADHLPTINKEYKNLETGDSRYICLNELDKACFQHDIAYEKDLPWITASDKILCDQAFIIAFNKASKLQNMSDVKNVLLQLFPNFLIKSLIYLHSQRP